MTIVHAYFSPCGETKKLALYLHKHIGGPLIDLTSPFVRDTVVFSENTLLILSLPVYSAQVVKPLLKVLEKVKSKWVVLNISYGQMTYGSIIHQLKDMLPFSTVLAYAITPTKHSYKDEMIEINYTHLDEIIKKVNDKSFTPCNIKTYKKAFGARFLESFRTRYNYKITINKEDCTHCLKCIALCPVNAIPRDLTLSNTCIRCSRCVKECPENVIHAKQSWFLKLYLRKPKNQDTIVSI